MPAPQLDQRPGTDHNGRGSVDIGGHPTLTSKTRTYHPLSGPSYATKFALDYAGPSKEVVLALGQDGPQPRLLEALDDG